MKHNKKVNPLTHFNNLKAEAVKKGNGQLANYKKSLKRFQGDVTGSQVASAASDAAMDNKINMSNNTYNTELANTRKLMEEAYKKADARATGFQGLNAKDFSNSISGVPSIRKNGGSLKPVPAGKVGLSKLPTPVRNKMGYQKKGGSIKRK